MHRQFSLQPFSRHYSHSTHPFLDFLEVDDSEEPAQIDVKAAEHAQLIEVLSQYKRVQKAGTLHTLTFVTVNDYLWLLRAVSQELVPLGRLAMFYLAAAVSDFFLPRQKMVRAPQPLSSASATLTHLTPSPSLVPSDVPRTTLILNTNSSDSSYPVRTQDSIGQGKPTHRDGSGAQDTEAARQ